MDKQLKLVELSIKIVKQTRVIHSYSGYSFNKETNKVCENKPIDKFQKYKYYTYN